MRRRWVIVAVVTGVAVATVGVSLITIYQASQHAPPFYGQAVARELEEQEPARDQFVVQMTTLASDLHRPGRWQSLFTAEQINAWLALELAESFPELLPDELHDPRIAIDEDELTIACRYETPEISTVLSLTVEAYVHEPQVLALRIRRARAGALPVPLAHVLDSITHAARSLKLRLTWSKSHGDPVALIMFPRPHDSQANALQLEAIELREGELFIAGLIGPVPRQASPAIAERGLEQPAALDEAEEAQPLVGAAPKETRQK